MIHHMEVELGMVIRPDVIYDAYNSIDKEILKNSRIIYLTPKGEVLTQEKVKNLSKEKNMYIKINLEITGSLKNRIIADIYFEDEIYDDIILQGKELYIQKKDLKKLEDGEYYILDLLECNVYKEKELIGKVTDILNNNITETLEIDRKRDNRKKIINSNN